ncbi:sugar ABC transporter substrate-binding protein [Jeotgalibacillus terrae]|uniref:Sugar ABC transporter substrate-binding protein n=1 Tax=Jeotgalibacillus terrae TaxID=587735 RepID=A0ABW5ZIS1_9BACL|nr:substrate-binding domain-containing protein [Jeotgalibacillus terrae]MBM7579732.1 D-xylose transport system substrate-binding protein [Jeotgalibacillus terrae]
MNKRFTLLSAWVMTILLIACTPDEQIKEVALPPEAESKSLEDIKIGFSMDTLQEDRWFKDRELFVEAAEKAGVEVEVTVANGDDVKQVWQTEKMISEGIDVLVVVPHNAESMAAIVERAHDAGIKVLSYDRLVRNAEVDLYLSYDNEQVGILQATVMTELVPEGNYVYLGGAETDYNAHLMKQGVFKVLKPYIDKGDITVVFNQWTKDWVPEVAKANMETALEVNHQQIDAVIAGNDATAGAAIEALAAYDLAGSIPVAGQDADLAGVQRIVNGTQNLTMYKSIDDLSERAVELAIKLALNEEIQEDRTINNGKINVPSILLPPVPVDRTNIKETVIADGFHQKKDIYQ